MLAGGVPVLILFYGDVTKFSPPPPPPYSLQVHLSSSFILLSPLKFIPKIYISLAYPWHIFGISLAYLWCIFDISLAYLWHIFDIYLAYVWHIFGISLAYI